MHLVRQPAALRSLFASALLIVVGCSGAAIGASTDAVRPGVWAGLAGVASTLLLALSFGDGERLRADEAISWFALVAVPLAGRIAGREPRIWTTGLVFALVVFARGAVLFVSLARGAPRLPLAGAVLLAALAVHLPLAAWAGSVLDVSGDEPHYLVLAGSLLRDGDFDLANDFREARYTAYHPRDLESHTIRTESGELLPAHDVGLTFVVLPGFALAGRTGATLEIAAASAGVAALIFVLATSAGASRLAAIATAGLFSVASPLGTFADQVYPEMPSALLALAALALLARDDPGEAHAFGAGLLLGALPWLSVRNWLVTLPLAIAFAWHALRRNDRRAALALLAGGAAPVLLFCAFDLWLFHRFVPNAGYLHLVAAGHPAGRPTGLALALAGWSGLLLDGAFGLLPAAPIYLCAFLGLWRARRGEAARQTAVVLVLTLGAIGANAFWYGGWAPPSRYLVVALALSAPWAALVLPSAWRSRRVLTSALAGTSLAVAVAFAAFPFTRYTFPDGRSGALAEFVGRLAGTSWGGLFPSLLRLEPRDVALAAAWLSLAALAFTRLAGAGEEPRGATGATGEAPPRRGAGLSS